MLLTVLTQKDLMQYIIIWMFNPYLCEFNLFMALGTDPINIFPKNCSEDDIEWGLPSFPSFFTVEIPRRFLSFLYEILLALAHTLLFAFEWS